MVETVRELLRLNADWQAQLVATGLLVIVLGITRKVVIRVSNRRMDEPTIRFYTQKLVTYATTVLGALLLFPIWVKNSSTLGTSVALVSAGLAIALSDVVKDMAGWLFILLRRPFHIGDRIEIGGHAGDVIDIQAFDFILFEIGARVHGDDPTGRTVRIPNGDVFSKAITNFSAEFEFMWQELAVLITFESDWRRAREVVLQAVQHQSDDELRDLAASQLRDASAAIQIDGHHLEPTVYVEVLDSGVLITGRHLVRVLETRRMEDRAWQSLLAAFEKEDSLELAYPTVRTFLRDPVSLAPADSSDTPDQEIAQP